jgi:ubiquinone biosynthesis protein
MSENIGLRGFAGTLRKESSQWLETLPQLPNLVFSALQKIDSGRIRIEGHDEEYAKIRNSIKQANRRTVRAVIGSGLIVSAALTTGLSTPAVMTISGVSLISWLLAGGGIATLGSIILVRSQR